MQYDAPVDDPDTEASSIDDGLSDEAAAIRAQLLARKKFVIPAASGDLNAAPDMSEILNAIVPPLRFKLDGKALCATASLQPPSRLDVLQLQEVLDKRVLERQARPQGLCPVREELYSQLFGTRFPPAKNIHLVWTFPMLLLRPMFQRLQQLLLPLLLAGKGGEA